jgi:hypothetical protein
MQRTIAVLGGLLLIAAGCGIGGKPTATVTGQVTYNGTPLSGGAITFHGEGGNVRSGYVDAGGMYTIVGAPVGPVTVTVVAAQPTAPPDAGGAGSKGGSKTAAKHPSGKTGGPIVGSGVTIPPKYQDKSQSGLSYTLTSGKQTIDIPLK